MMALLGLFLTAGLALVGASPVLGPRQAPAGAPTATVKNGSYYGVYNGNYSQDLFLGIPFAQPPLESLRFANPQSLNLSWEGAWPATNYAFECIGYGGDQVGYEQSEDCLYLNVIRPSGYDGQALPVAVWIHGGGFYDGGIPDRRYNLSFVVDNSVSIGKPIIGVSIAYRLGAFGFIAGDTVQAAGQTNIGLRDQRLALHWIQENIGGFGGDPTKVTIWGESAGAESVGFHIIAYNGRDDKIFRSGMSESGNPLSYTTMNGTSAYNQKFADLVTAAGCSSAEDALTCLRQVPLFVLNNILNGTTEFNSGWNPVIDGDFLQDYGVNQLAAGNFVHVPIIQGANSDEGESFSPIGINTEDDFIEILNTSNSLQNALPDPLVQQILESYPFNAHFGIPSAKRLGGNVILGPPYGAHFRQSAAYCGDLVFIAARRKTCETWAAAGVDAYCYRFNAVPAGEVWPVEVPHFSEVAFVMNNLNGLGYVTNPFLDKPASYAELSDLMSKSWASFVYDNNPNNWTGRSVYGADEWPLYATVDPQVIVWDANVTSYAQNDTFRAEGIALINDNAQAYLVGNAGGPM